MKERNMLKHIMFFVLIAVGMMTMTSAQLYAVDTDGDGVENGIDIDDDNDGILDIVENPGVNNNGGFEEPSIGGSGSHGLVNADTVPFWKTNAIDNKMEIWHDGFDPHNLGLQPYDGEQFIEMNTNQPTSVYQDINTTGGEILTWQIAHRGRNGTDSAR